MFYYEKIIKSCYLADSGRNQSVVYHALSGGANCIYYHWSST